MKTQITDEMVTRFLSWNLPAAFMPDCYIAFKHPGVIALGLLEQTYLTQPKPVKCLSM